MNWIYVRPRDYSSPTGPWEQVDDENLGLYILMLVKQGESIFEVSLTPPPGFVSTVDCE
jgi:hypothetical protein